MDGIHHTLEELRAGVGRLTDTATAPTARDVSAVIDQLERVLKELSMACYTLGYAAANEPEWLAALHDVGAAVGSAARACRVQRPATVES
jgi:hypothetical protein